LLVTVFHEDEDAAALWKKIAGLSDDRIIRIPTDANYWRMGDTGPCGPCSEIFFDHGEHIPGGPPGSPDEDGDRFIEIWNLVFMQFEELSSGEKVALPSPSIDTGMGLERLAAVLQGQHDNYDIDLMQNLIAASAEVSGADIDGPHAVSHRVVADHLRSVSFLMADGVMPSNEGRGYVLRRIMRRAMRHAHLMEVADPLMWRLVPALVGEMGQHYPELVRAEALITETLKLEESRFRRTLERGLRLLEDEVAKLPEKAQLPGDVAFRLYDTYGFPLDLTQDALRAQGRGVDTGGFDQSMAKQRADARAAWAGSGDQATDKVWFDIRERSGATEFLGYGTEVAEGRVEALVVDAAEIDSAHDGNEVAVVMNQTPFYGESGGQAGDTGILIGGQGAEIEVRDTRKAVGDLHVHIGTIRRGTVKLGDVLELRVNADRRGALRANHSATHLLHAALRKVLGDHVTQKGSLVASDKLRFDISHPKAMSADEISEVEALVNNQVRGNGSVGTVLASPEEAVEQGALALFGEKYGDEVRVVSMGAPREDGHPYSVELCGGTHVSRTGDIGFFKILTEGAVAAGVRRIEAVTGVGALRHVQHQERTIRAAATLIKAPEAELSERVSGLLDDRKRLERELSETRRAMAAGGAQGGPEVQDVNGVKFSGRALDGVPPKELRGMADDAKKSLGSGVVAIATAADGKAALVVGVTADLVERFDAVSLVRVGAAALGGKGGGGRPDMAQAGGPNSAALDEALAAVEQAIAAG
jgi:alanyl-tRNA synthetase